MKPLKKPFLTTGQVAKMTGFAPRTVNYWVDSGKLAGFIMPGSRDRRVSRNELAKFLRSRNIPIHEVVEQRVMLLCTNRDFVRDLQDAMPADGSVAWAVASTEFEAGILCERFQFSMVVIDAGIGSENAIKIAGFVKRHDAQRRCAVIGIANEDGSPMAEMLSRQDFDHVFCHPVHVYDVAAAISGESTAEEVSEEVIEDTKKRPKKKSGEKRGRTKQQAKETIVA